MVFVVVWLIAVTNGGWWIILIPLYSTGVASLLDRFLGLSEDNLDPMALESQLFWHKLVTWVWVPIQITLILGTMVAVFWFDHLSVTESILMFLATGTITGGIGITYAHELIHQKDKRERLLGDILLATVLYGHFRTEHILVHHRYIGTPRDAVTARYNESIYHFLPRATIGSFKSAWHVEAERQTKRGRKVGDWSNPFWRYGAGAGIMLFLSAAIGGWAGIALFIMQAMVAVLYLEIIDYIEHYGLTRKYLGDGKYENTAPRHSWNANHKFTNWLLINLQRHSDHHYKPDRRFALLQTYDKADAPQLPYGYPIMAVIACNPRHFRRLMNPEVRKWRNMYYPEITDWTPYKNATTPMPR
ncbi:MAG: alkane 1-monooxygenase [Rhodobacteraceae bacterium]|nr:alkane 1-monooxygenase [Paracoccaceae bacterium]